MSSVVGITYLAFLLVICLYFVSQVDGNVIAQTQIHGYK